MTDKDEALKRIYDLVKSDSLAMTFQKMGLYREMILNEIKKEVGK